MAKKTTRQAQRRPAKTKPAKQKPQKAENPAAEVDFLGARVGTRKAQINALLSKSKAKTVKQIREEGGIPGSYRDYFDELAKAGKIVGDHKAGWKLARRSSSA